MTKYDLVIKYILKKCLICWFLCCCSGFSLKIALTQIPTEISRIGIVPWGICFKFSCQKANLLKKVMVISLNCWKPRISDSIKWETKKNKESFVFGTAVQITPLSCPERTLLSWPLDTSISRSSYSTAGTNTRLTR